MNCRVKEERSGNRRVFGEVMSLPCLGPGVARPRDRDIIVEEHDIVILRAETRLSRNSARARGLYTSLALFRPGQVP